MHMTATVRNAWRQERVCGYGEERLAMHRQERGCGYGEERLAMHRQERVCCYGEERLGDASPREGLLLR